MFFFSLAADGYRSLFFFFFNDTATTEIYTLSLHDALPIYPKLATHRICLRRYGQATFAFVVAQRERSVGPCAHRSEEHTSELQSRQYLVCRLLLEKKKTIQDWPHEADDQVRLSSESEHAPT